MDGFIDVNELGIVLENLCDNVLKPNPAMDFYLMLDKTNSGYCEKESVLKELRLKGILEETALNEFNNNQINLFHNFHFHFSIYSSIDREQKGLLTYWDIFFL